MSRLRTLTQDNLKQLKRLLHRYALKLVAEDETIALGIVNKVITFVEGDIEDIKESPIKVAK